MDVTIDDKCVMSAGGFVATWKSKAAPDCFLTRVREALAAFARLQKAYGESLAGDAKVRGQERVMMMDLCEEVVDAGVGALFYALAEKHQDVTDPERQLVVPGHETVFWVKKSGLGWNLRQRVLLGSSYVIRDTLRSCAEGPVRTLLVEMRDHAADGVIDAAERERLMPAILSVVRAVLELRSQIETCATSR